VIQVKNWKLKNTNRLIDHGGLAYVLLIVTVITHMILAPLTVAPAAPTLEPNLPLPAPLASPLATCHCPEINHASPVTALSTSSRQAIGAALEPSSAVRDKVRDDAVQRTTNPCWSITMCLLLLDH
jgi:hypothetical protein